MTEAPAYTDMHNNSVPILTSTVESPNLGLFMAWDNDALVVTDKVMLDKVERKALSPSTSKSMASCQARWLVDRVMPSEENPFDPAPLGTSGHLCLERMFTLPAEMRTPDQLMTEVLTLADEQWGTDVSGAAKAEKHRWVVDVHSKIAPIFDMEDPRKVVVHTNEMQLEGVKVGGVPFNGFIDRVDIVTDEDGNEGISVIDYKGLALDTPITTPTGWTTMGELEVGDQVVGSDGRPANVVIKSKVHNRPCYRITMSDGSSVVCDNVHLWQVNDLTRGGHDEILDADGVAERFAELAAKGKTQSLVIKNALPFEFETKDLPINPWVLGAWLGDGTSKSGEISVGTQDIDDMRILVKQNWGSFRERSYINTDGSTMHAVTLSNPTGKPTTKRTLKPISVEPRDASMCDYGHDVSGDIRLGCTECATIRAAVRESVRASFGPPTNVKPDANACPSWHPYPADRKDGDKCLSCHAGRERDRRAGAKTDVSGRTNVKPRPGFCEFDHECGLHRVPSGDTLCQTCVNAFNTTKAEVLGAPWNIDRNVYADEQERVHATLHGLLVREGLLRNKHIPEDYLRASYDQRLALLRGLMDTDGSWNPVKKAAVFVNMNEGVADGVVQLALSMGVTAQKYKTWITNDVRPDGWAYYVKFTPTGFNPFSLPRKASLVDQWSRKQSAQSKALSTRRFIKNVESVESVPTQCIQVDAPDSLYLCGPNHTISHNTGKVPKNITMFGDDHGDQLRLYALAYEAKTGIMPVQAWVYYTAFGQVKKVSLAKASLSKTLRAYQTGWNTHNKAIETATFNTKPSALCGWCPAVESCDSAIKPDGTPYSRSPRAAQFVDLGIPKFVERKPVPESPFDGDDEPIFDEHMIREESSPGLITAETRKKPSKKDATTDTSETQEGSRNTEAHMSDVKGIFGEELKPWMDGDGRLNPASYAATGVFGMVEFAMEAITDAGEKITPKSVRAVTGTLAKVVLDAQVALEGDVDWNKGLNTRLRGALRTALKTMPLPFGGTADEWESWVASATRRVLSTAVMANDLFSDFDAENAEPWLAIAVDAKAEAE